MKVHGYKRLYNNPFFVYVKKHYCFKCKERLFRFTVSKIVNSNSREAENFDFGNGDTYVMGNIKFIWDEFQCSFCGKRYTVKELRYREHKNRKN